MLSHVCNVHVNVMLSTLMADAIAAFGSQLHVAGPKNLELWGDDRPTTPAKVPKAPLRPGERLSVYWTEMKEWYSGTFKSSRVEDADDGVAASSALAASSTTQSAKKPPYRRPTGRSGTA